MKITISTEELKKGLNLVERICTKNLVLPILNNVLLSAEESILKLTTTNLEIAILYYCLAKIEEKGEITIPVRTLSNLISFLEIPNIKLETKGKNLNIVDQKYQAQIKGMDPKDFPIIPKIERTQVVELNPFPLCEGILQVIDFCATGQARPELSGIFFSFSKDQLKIVATDSFRLAEKTLFFEKPQEELKEKSFILPRGAAREFVNVFSDKKEKIKLFISSGQIMFESYFEGTQNLQSQLISRLIEGDFPDYQAVIPKTFHTQILIDKKQFLNRVKTVSIFSGGGNEIFLLVDPKKKKVEISAKSTEIGEANVEMGAEIKGEGVKTCFNWRFLIEGISKIQTDEIIFELNQEGGPGVLKPKEQQDFLYILMPIKQA
ncbi:MAG: DNA polymerase III subunit beta [Candidatus Pacebacteria bacterium]|nr:DNA polymerase III subunit beta [Candidatus Paceibacterota bacterium]